MSDEHPSEAALHSLGGDQPKAKRTRVRVSPPLRDDAVVQKANESIAIRPKKGRLTLLSRRIYNAMLYNAQQQGIDERQFSIPLATLIGDAHFNSRNVALLKEHIREMQTTLIEWNSVGEGEQRWTSSQLLGTVEIAERGSGHPVIITWSYPEKVRERLLKPTRYTKLLLEVGAQMRSYAAAVLFELGMQYLTSPSRLTMREDLFWWASVLTGRSDIDKVDYRYFKRDVVRPALAEVDALQDEFSLELIEHKEGRRICELQFLVHRKTQVGLGVTDERNAFDLELVDRLRKMGMKDDEADRLYSKTDEGLLRSTVELVEQRQRNLTLPPLSSPVAYLRDALKKGYASAGIPMPGPEGQAPQEIGPEAPSAPKRLPLKASVQAIREEWERDRAKRAELRFAALSSLEQQEVVLHFEAEQLEGLLQPIAAAWRKEKANSKIAGPVFFRWLGRRTQESEPGDSELLTFAIEKGMFSVG